VNRPHPQAVLSDMRKAFRTLLIVPAAGVVLGFGLTACSSGSSGPSYGGSASSAAAPSPAAAAAAPATAASTITIQSFAFGAPLTVQPGQTVSVVNQDSAPHTVTADDGKSFDAKAGPGGSGTFTAPMAPGSYAFHCSVHPDMHGTLTVAG
jgi:plastocyanin